MVEDIHGALRSCRLGEVAHAVVRNTADIERIVRRTRPDVVFNACETLGGDAETEPLVPRVLERMGVEFTGSKAACLETCLDKMRASTLLRAAGVPVPATYAPFEVPASAFPVIVKPAREDGSVGISAASVVHDDDALAAAARALSEQGLAPVAQRYVDGREVVLSFCGWPEPIVLSPGEILYDPEVFAGRARILTYASKWDPSSPDYEGTRSVGAELSSDLLGHLTTVAARAFRALGLRDYGRVDMRLDAEGRPFVIDVNPNCDLSRDGGFMRAAARTGLAYADAIERILVGALARTRP